MTTGDGPTGGPARATRRARGEQPSHDRLLSELGLDSPGHSGGARGDSDAPPRRRRKWPWILGAVLLVLLVLGALAAVFVVQALSVRDNLQAAKDRLSQVTALVKDGDAAQLQVVADDILRNVTAADETVRGPLWALASAVPGVGPNVVAVSETTQATNVLVRDAMPIALDLLAVVDVDNLKVEGGGVNLQPLREAGPQLPALNAAFVEAQRHVDLIDRAAILPFVDENIGQLVDIVDQATPTLALAEKYLPTILSLLGGEGERTYVVLFQNNAELRATGGNPGSGAILTVDDGRVEMRGDAEALRFAVAGNKGVYPQSLPADRASLFETDTVRYSQNFSRTPDFADTARLVDGVWTDLTGEPLDGVISIDPVALSFMLEVAGTVSVPGEKQRVTSENAVSLLLSESYERFGKDGAAADRYFAKVSAAVFSKIMAGGWDVTAMIEQIQKSAAEQRIYMWFPAPAEQAMAVELGVEGSVTSANDQTTQLGIYLNDASYSKLEYYLSTSMAVTCSAVERTVTTAITMNNAVPSANLSGYTLAWRNGSLGYPRTTMLLDVVSMALPGGALVDPESGDRGGWDRTGTYNGREAKSVFVVLPMGQSRTVSFTSTVPDDATAPLSVRYSPTVTQTPVAVDGSCDALFPPPVAQ